MRAKSKARNGIFVRQNTLQSGNTKCKRPPVIQQRSCSICVRGTIVRPVAGREACLSAIAIDIETEALENTAPLYVVGGRGTSDKNPFGGTILCGDLHPVLVHSSCITALRVLKGCTCHDSRVEFPLIIGRALHRDRLLPHLNLVARLLVVIVLSALQVKV